MAHVYARTRRERIFKLTQQQRRELLRVVQQLPDECIASAVYGAAEPTTALECEAMAVYCEHVGEDHPDPGTKASYLGQANRYRQDAQRLRSMVGRHLSNAAMEVSRG